MGYLYLFMFLYYNFTVLHCPSVFNNAAFRLIFDLRRATHAKTDIKGQLFQNSKDGVEIDGHDR